MTIGELADLLNEAVENGWEDYPVSIRKFGTSKDTCKDVYMFDLVSRVNSEDEYDDNSCGEIIYKE